MQKGEYGCLGCRDLVSEQIMMRKVVGSTAAQTQPGLTSLCSLGGLSQLSSPTYLASRLAKYGDRAEILVLPRCCLEQGSARVTF